jgi:hypothetical protein
MLEGLKKEKRNRRKGKIARLSKEWRDVVNLMLLDGATYIEVVEKLATAGFDVNDENVRNWNDGGYQDWLKEQERFEDMRFKREFALELVKENEGSVVHEAGLQVAASQIYELLTDFDVESLKTALKSDPENYSRLVNAMSKLSDSGLKYQRYKAEVKAAREKIERELTAGKEGGLTPEAIGKIQEALNLM